MRWSSFVFVLSSVVGLPVAAQATEGAAAPDATTPESNAPGARERPACTLSRSPILPSPLSRPASARCLDDEDGNGLDDAIEREIARCFAPELRFDREEPARTRREPHTLYNVRREPGTPDRLRLGMTFLFGRDAGFGEGFLCRGTTEHPGDTEPMEMSLSLVEDERGVRVVLEWIQNGLPGGPIGPDAFERVPGGARPILYPSRGKHHLYAHAFDGAYYDSPIGCRDRARGDGAAIVPGVSSTEGPPPALDHVPVFFALPASTASHANAPLTPDRSRWFNACLVGLHPDDRGAWRPATRSLRANRFGPGEPFAGEEIEGERFGGGTGEVSATVTPIWQTLVAHEALGPGGTTTWDVDGDGRPEMLGIAPLLLDGSDRSRTWSHADDAREPVLDLRRLARRACVERPPSRSSWLARGARLVAIAASPSAGPTLADLAPEGLFEELLSEVLRAPWPRDDSSTVASAPRARRVAWPFGGS